MELLWLLCFVLVVVGFAGAVLPAIPGPPLVFFGLVAGAAADGFDRVGWVTLTVLFLLTCLTFGVDIAATALGAQRAGASKLAVVGALLGSLVGLAFGLPGLLVGPFVGALAGEWYARRDLLQAGKVGFATWLGMFLAAVAKLAILLAMVGLFALAWWL
ncbi:MAG: DUF456 family protein [Thermoanaerobaculia bacterium]|jgi:uncharacterized protein YqgC (DUF456 family)|nr:DUF456 family protein [Thermoanaerobaculia bacterium]MBP9826700.1 DUF456 family protein [Thermoanaerobaculia bacterium]